VEEFMTTEEAAIGLLESLSAKVDALRIALQAPEFYSNKEAAKVVNVSADHVRRAVIGRVLAASNVGTMARATYRVARTDLLAWVEKGNAGAPERKKNVRPRSRHH
jgi:excisionase family DNA binding protein